MTIGQRVRFEVGKGGSKANSYGHVATICPIRGVLVIFEHVGGAWMAERELMPVEEEV